MTALRDIIENFHRSVFHLLSETDSFISNYDNGYIIGNLSDDDWCALWYILTFLSYADEDQYATIEEISKIKFML